MQNIEFGVDCDSRVALVGLRVTLKDAHWSALCREPMTCDFVSSSSNRWCCLWCRPSPPVGPNGAGKSTLLKLMTGDVEPSRGSVSRHSALKIGRYHQHSTDVLDKGSHPLDFFLNTYEKMKKPVDEWRGFLGKFGISGRLQTTEIGLLSDGQKSRLVFAMICIEEPNLLLLDEPTNHLDIEAIDSLAKALNRYKGGLVLVSHDFRLIDQVAKEIWVCEKKGVRRYEGTIHDYKKELAKKMGVYRT